MDLNLRANLTSNLPRIVAKLVSTVRHSAICRSTIATTLSNLGLRDDGILHAEVHCAAVFCAAGCELCVRRSAPPKTYRKRAKFNRSSSVKF